MNLAEQLEVTNTRASEPEWMQAHHALTRLARERARHDFEAGRWLLAAQRSAVHVRLGFVSILEYAERVLDWGPRLVSERLRVVDALESLPELCDMLARGDLHWTCARELTRVAVADTEREWIELARGKTSRQIERLVAGHRRGDLPDDPVSPEARRSTLSFNVSAQTKAMFRDAITKLRREAGGAIDDDAALLQMARQILGGPTDEGRSSYQVVITRCPDCGRGQQHASGEAIELPNEALEAAECDAQHVPIDSSMTHVGENNSRPERATQTIPPAIRRLVLRRDGGRCVVPGCRSARFLDLHHIHLRSEGGSHDPDLLISTCGAHHLALHEGKIVVEGRISTGICFFHADGTPYGGAVSPMKASLMSDAFLALRGLGFGETESRRALSEIRAEVGDAMTLEAVLFAALRFLRPKPMA